MSRFDIIRLPLLAGFLACALMLHACSEGGGDGGGIGGSGIIAPIATDDFSYGTITGFGSVIINSQRYSTDNSEFVIDGQVGSQSDLAVGMLVSANVDFDQMSASQVRFEPTLLGPISFVDVIADELLVLGQRVEISANTVFDDISLAALSPGSFIQLTGNRDATGSVRTTWVARAPSTEKVQITGNLTNLQIDEQRFSIGQLIIDYSSAQPQTLDLANDMMVIVSAPVSALDIPASTLRAQSIEPTVLDALDSGQRIEIEGIISNVMSEERFLLNGHIVLTDADTGFQLVGGAPVSANNAINRNTRVEVKGYVQSSGTIKALRVNVIPSDESRLQGRVESIDTQSRSVRVLGVDVGTTDRTRFDIDDDSGSTGFEALGVGSYVEVNASFIDNTLVAARIEIEEPDEEASLRGPVTRLDVNTSVLEVLGIPLIDNGDTDYENAAGQEVDRTRFLQSLSIGDLVEAEWDEFQSTSLPPDDIEVEN